MDSQHARAMMDAFYEAKRIRDQLPPLPEGVCSSYIRTLDALHQLLARSDGLVRVSDVADFQHLPRPVVTWTVKEMEAGGLVVKRADANDRRVVHLEMTEQGEALYQTYVTEYFDGLTQKLSGVSNEETETMVRTIHEIRDALQRKADH